MTQKLTKNKVKLIDDEAVESDIPITPFSQTTKHQDMTYQNRFITDHQSGRHVVRNKKLAGTYSRGN